MCCQRAMIHVLRISRDSNDVIDLVPIRTLCHSMKQSNGMLIRIERHENVSFRQSFIVFLNEIE